ncbi:hypothetical protein M885DRAFT_547313 [Pelagophyceae sp. CCMP2097]|nr:hypothetical protein M885DRAFT_547313 [Pelagophyceae sp. CCMP2097]
MVLEKKTSKRPLSRSLVQAPSMGPRAFTGRCPGGLGGSPWKPSSSPCNSPRKDPDEAPCKAPRMVPRAVFSRSLALVCVSVASFHGSSFSPRTGLEAGSLPRTVPCKARGPLLGPFSKNPLNGR